MIRLVSPLTAALALALVAPAASAGGPVRSTMASWSAPGYAQPGVAVEPAPAPAPQPYADPSAPAPAAPQPYYPGPGPQPYADPGAQPAPAPAPAPAYVAPEPRGRRKGLMIAGWTLFGASYLATAFVAAIVSDSCRALDDAGCRNTARMAMIPAIGPFLAIPHMQTDYVTPKALMAFPGLIQTAGLIMGIAGTVQFIRDGRQPRYVGVDGLKLGPKLRLGAAPTRFYDGGTVTLGYRF